MTAALEAAFLRLAASAGQATAGILALAHVVSRRPTFPDLERAVPRLRRPSRGQRRHTRRIKARRRA